MCGSSRYGIFTRFSSESAKSPRPLPRTRPTLGSRSTRLRTANTQSSRRADTGDRGDWEVGAMTRANPTSVALPVELLDERFADEARRVARGIAAVARDLAHERRADEPVHRAGRQEHGVELGRAPQPAHDDARLLGFAVVDEEAVERLDDDVWQVRRHPGDEVEPLFDGEQRRPGGVTADADDDVAEERGRALDEVEVPEGRGVEASGVDGEPGDGLVHRVLRGGALDGGGGALTGGAGGAVRVSGPSSVGSGSIHMKRPSSANVRRKKDSMSAPTTPARSMSRPAVSWLKSAPSIAGILARSKPAMRNTGTTPRLIDGSSGIVTRVFTSTPAFFQAAS